MKVPSKNVLKTIQLPSVPCLAGCVSGSEEQQTAHHASLLFPVSGCGSTDVLLRWGHLVAKQILEEFVHCG